MGHDGERRLCVTFEAVERGRGVAHRERDPLDPDPRPFELHEREKDGGEGHDGYGQSRTGKRRGHR